MDGGKYPASLVAKYFIKKSTPKDNLTPLKLQKILYYTQGWYLANFERPLFEDRIEAWKFGPAIRSIYNEYRDFGNRPIIKSVSAGEVGDIDGETRKFLDKVWETYKGYSGGDLVFSTHHELPWTKVRSDMDDSDSGGIEITRGSMMDYFKKLISDG